MKRLRNIVSAFVIVLQIAGCAVYHPKPFSPEEKAAGFEKRTLDDPALRKFLEGHLGREITTWPPQSWDFTLLSLAALYYHPDLAVARAGEKGAKAAVITAGARPNPSLSVTPQFSANPPSDVSPWFLIAALDIPIETAGKRGYRLNRARYLARAASFETVATAWRVRGHVRKAMLGLSLARQEATLRGQETEELAELVSMVRQRAAAGEVAASEVLAAQVLLDRAELQLRGVQKREGEARVQVASAIGLPVGAFNKVAVSTETVEELPSPASFSVPDLRRRALLSRPDILAALAVYEAAESSLQLEIARQYPDINLLPGYTWDQGQNEWAFGVALTLPILNRNEGPIAEAEARRAQAEAAFVTLQGRIIGDIDRAAASFEAATQKLAAAESLLTTQKSHYQSAQAMYDAGEVDRVVLISARLDYVGSGLSRVSALSDAQEALGALEEALYYPLTPETPSAPHAPMVLENREEGR